jgi:hypothetical protein
MAYRHEAPIGQLTSRYVVLPRVSVPNAKAQHLDHLGPSGDQGEAPFQKHHKLSNSA